LGLCQAVLVFASIFQKAKDLALAKGCVQNLRKNFVVERNVDAETRATSTQNKNNEENKKVQKLDKFLRNCEIEKLCLAKKVKMLLQPKTL